MQSISYNVFLCRFHANPTSLSVLSPDRNSFQGTHAHTSIYSLFACHGMYDLEPNAIISTTRGGKGNENWSNRYGDVVLVVFSCRNPCTDSQQSGRGNAQKFVFCNNMALLDFLSHVSQHKKLYMDENRKGERTFQFCEALLMLNFQITLTPSPLIV